MSNQKVGASGLTSKKNNNNIPFFQGSIKESIK